MPDGDFQRLRYSPEQQRASDAVLTWLRSGTAQVFHLSGLAGVGKTEIVTRLGRELEGVQYCAFTGKAASVLRQRGASNAATLHSLLYGAPILTEDGELIWHRREDKPSANLIIADECSCIDARLGRDLLKLGIKTLVTGDALQLPPVSGTAFFDGEPDITLTEIHRQAAGSQPLELATAIRGGKRVRPEPFDLDEVLEADIVICALNKTRKQVNRMFRRALGIDDRNNPVVGDRMVCLRNNYSTGVFNGTLWTVEAIGGMPANDLLLNMRLVDDVGNIAEVVAHEDGFHCNKLELQHPEYRGLDLFDYGYALTCHKAQGSEWSNVAVIDETESSGFKFIAESTPLSLPEFERRWTYTGLTRAKRQVTVMRAPR